MELRQLEFFLTCAEKGSLTRAAEALYTTQPHVSQVIRALERELGTALFHRTGSGIRLTEAGERIRFYAENARRSAALIRESCAAGPQGDTLRLAVNPSSRLAFLTEDFICRQAGEAPALQYTECGVETMLKLVQREYDLGFLFVPEDRLAAFTHMAQRHSVRYTPLLQSDLVLHCGRASPFYGRERVTPEELNGCRCIQLEDDYFALEELLTQSERFRRGRGAIRRVISTNSDHLMLEVLRRTELCNIGSYWLRDTGGETLSRAVIEGFEGRVSFGFLRGEQRALSRAAEEFLQTLREQLAQGTAGAD